MSQKRAMIYDVFRDRMKSLQFASEALPAPAAATNVELEQILQAAELLESVIDALPGDSVSWRWPARQAVKMFAALAGGDKEES